MNPCRKTVPLALRHTMAGQDWTAPRHASTWARSHAGEPAIEDIACASIDLKTWAACVLVGVIFWTAVFAWVFA